jgi:hypothetical protein
MLTVDIPKLTPRQKEVLLELRDGAMLSLDSHRMANLDGVMLQPQVLAALRKIGLIAEKDKSLRRHASADKFAITQKGLEVLAASGWPPDRVPDRPPRWFYVCAVRDEGAERSDLVGHRLHGPFPTYLDGLAALADTRRMTRESERRWSRPDQPSFDEFAVRWFDRDYGLGRVGNVITR